MRTRMLALAVGTTALPLALAATIGAANPGNRTFVAKLSGANEVPAVQTNATGTAQIRINKRNGTLCWLIHVKSLSSAATGAHIHPGLAGVEGGVAVALGTPNGVRQNATSKGCVTVGSGGLTAAELNDILANPRAFYVNVHTTVNPDGEVRGQLKR